MRFYEGRYMELRRDDDMITRRQVVSVSWFVVESAKKRTRMERQKMPERIQKSWCPNLITRCSPVSKLFKKRLMYSLQCVVLKSPADTKGEGARSVKAQYCEDSILYS